MINIIVFATYLIVLVIIGYVTYIRTKTYDDYTIAGRSNNKWITALSTESADMSGWLLLGLPGTAFVVGYSSVWLMIGLVFGTMYNWIVVGKRLRTITEHYNSITLMDFYEKRFGDDKGIISTVSCIVIVIFMIVNSSAEIIGSGKLLNVAFGFDYKIGIYIGLLIALIYTFLGGYLAVSWSNLFQGSIMFFTIILVPIIGIKYVGGIDNLYTGLISQDANFFSFTAGSTEFWPIFSLIMGGLGVGIAYPGMPHVITNFMAIKDPDELKKSTLIATIWVALTSYGAAYIGMLGRHILPNIEDPEQVFLPLAQLLFSSNFIGVCAAAVMAAILSSVSAYLLVAASSFASSIYKKFDKNAGDKRLILVQRISVIIVSIIALLMSLEGGFVYKVALFATAGLGSCFVPIVLFSLYWKGANKQGAISSMIVGLVVVLLWWNLGLSNYIYELVPALALSTITFVVVSKLTGGPDKNIENKFLDYLKSINKVSSKIS